MNANPLQMMIQMLGNGRNPIQLIQQMAGQNPQMAQFMQMINGKNPQQLRQMAENMARERGTTVADFAKELGIPFSDGK